MPNTTVGLEFLHFVNIRLFREVEIRRTEMAIAALDGVLASVDHPQGNAVFRGVFHDAHELLGLLVGEAFQGFLPQPRHLRNGIGEHETGTRDEKQGSFDWQRSVQIGIHQTDDLASFLQHGFFAFRGHINPLPQGIYKLQCLLYCILLKVSPMNVPLYTPQGEKKGEIPLGKPFTGKTRKDLVKRAFLAERSLERQPYGADPLAGKRTSAHYHGRRHYRYTMMNREMSRMRRIHSQGFLNFTARFVPQAKKGRKAHPPKIEKQWELKINKKEHALALVSSLSATNATFTIAGKELQGPIVFEDGFQDLKKTKDILSALTKVGLSVAPKKTVRAGKGKSRNRRYRKKRGPLIIVTKKMPCPPGAEMVLTKDLSVSDLAPGGTPGRLCIWTQASLKEVSNGQ